MIKSIAIITFIIFAFSLIANTLSNLARIQELREIKKRLDTFEKAFRVELTCLRKIKNTTNSIEQRSRADNRVELIVKDETNAPLKYGDE